MRTFVEFLSEDKKLTFEGMMDWLRGGSKKEEPPVTQQKPLMPKMKPRVNPADPRSIMQAIASHARFMADDPAVEEFAMAWASNPEEASRDPMRFGPVKRAIEAIAARRGYGVVQDILQLLQGHSSGDVSAQNAADYASGRGHFESRIR